MSLSFLEGLQFRRMDSPIHRLDPRAKFVIALSILGYAMLFTEVIPLIVGFAILLPLVFAAKVFRMWVRTIKGVLVLAILIFAINWLVTPDLAMAVGLALRFVLLVAAFSLFFLTTSPDDLGLALEQSGVPYELTFAFTTAIRFVPVLCREAQTIVDAQRSRGLELERGGLLKRIRNYLPILVPLVVGAIRRSVDLAEAMESRAWGVSEKRTSLYRLKMRGRDYLAVLLSAAFFLLAMYVKLLSNQPLLPWLL